MRRKLAAAILLAVTSVLLSSVHGAEFFVSKQGADTNNGTSRGAAFLTVQKGVSALKPGDTLSIGPGEYFETVELTEFGDLNRETLIRAEVPGTVVLRGDRDADLEFTLVSGKRFVYVADCDLNVFSVQETDTLTNLAPSADMYALEFGPGRFCYDARAKKLYVSSSDSQSTERHHYTVGVTKGHGFHMFKCRRVTLEGLAASSYRTPVDRDVVLLPVSGFMLHETQQCIVRRCTAYYNGSGITINSGIGSNINQPGEGRANVVEDCVAYANDLDGIVAYNPSGETIRRCRSFRNQTYGARFYGGRDGDKLCLMQDIVAWGNPGGDYWTKGTGLSGFFEQVVADRCVAFRGCMFANFKNGLIGGGASRHGVPSSTINLPEGHKDFHQFLDANFADPLTFDFRFQATSSFAKDGGAQMGPYPYKANVYYVKTDGNDAADGLSMANALKTPAAAVRKLKPGDTLYIAPGRYKGDVAVTARDVRIRGRGLDPVVIGGGLTLANCESISVNRLELSGSVNVAAGSDVKLTNCVFSGSVVQAGQVQRLSMSHNVFVSALQLKECSQTILSGNVYAAAPAVVTDSLDSIAYSSYNSYPNAASCWTTGGNVLPLKQLQPRHEACSTIATPEFLKSNGTTVVANEYRFGGRGPLSTAIGPYREWQPKQVNLVGPFVESGSAASADVEWWSTSPVQVELAWGDTPACTNRKQFKQNAFYSYSLGGLQPGKKYYVKVTATDVPTGADPARRFVVAEADANPVEFTAGGDQAQAHQPTTYYVALDGDDTRDGLSRTSAWRSPQTAADRVRPGDTVLIAGGTYPGTFYFRHTGEPDKPITFKAVPGEKVLINGMESKLHAGFVLYGKHHYRVDSLYFNGYSGIEDNTTGQEAGAIYPRDSADLQITRCSFSRGWGRCLEPHDCPDLLLRNCVFMNSMEAVMIYNSGGTVIENSVFISPLITHLHAYGTYGNVGKQASVRHCIFGENTRHKVHICPISVAGTMAENCFYMRWSQYDRKLYNDKTLPEHLAAGDAQNSLYVNPMMPGALGFRRGWQQIENSYESEDPYDPIEFNQLFATNPELLVRDIGLQPEAFSDFHFFAEKKWPYTKEWAAKVKEGMDAAEGLRKGGQALKASTTYVDLALKFPMIDRLKTEVLDRAAQCAVEAKDYDRAMKIAQNIPLQPFLVRRCMAILVEQKKFTELVNRAVGDSAPQVGWMCPENEMVMADAFYYRGLAYAQTGNLKAAEEDMRTMVDKGARSGYSPGPTVLAVAWKRLGDFYRTFAKNNTKALEAYREALKTTPNLEIADDLAAATKAVAEIQRK